MLMEMLKVNGLLRAQFVLGELRIDFFEDELLLLAVKVAHFGILGLSKEIGLPHWPIFWLREIKHSGNAVKPGFLGPLFLRSLFLFGLHDLSITSLLSCHRPLHIPILLFVVLKHMLSWTSFPSDTARNMILMMHEGLGATTARTTYEKEGRIAWGISTHVQERKT
jgi:hypothetical protein